jgi:23S rRNA pseudouridine1911/1915/1917 synthase
MKEISNKNNLQVLHEDNHIIVVNKRVGDIVQGDKTGDKPLSEVVRNTLKKNTTNQVKFSLAWYIV